MSGLLFLTTDDFHVSKGTKGNILCNSIPGFALILFYSPQCPHSNRLIPVFKRLPGTIGGCQFGLLNVSTNKNCVRMSKNTIVPIKYVPLLILYINGRPFIKYNGVQEENDIKSFILQVAKQMNNKQKFSSNSNIKENPRGGIPEYSIGHPLYGIDNVTYLEFEEAYEKNKKNKSSSNTGNKLFENNRVRSMQQEMTSAAMRHR